MSLTRGISLLVMLGLYGLQWAHIARGCLRRGWSARDAWAYQPVVQVAVFRKRLEWTGTGRGVIRTALGGAIRLRQRRTGHEERENRSRKS